ncbi:MAG: LysR family transcriptional regulator, partial [Rhodobacteraceae bacterium]|nr:LysR family transcriptional regulator [Paracoccaceae bacterium]
MDIDLRLLRSFVQMHEAGSLARAADRMGCTPAAMSMRLKMIETQLGAPLFLRRPTGLVPNARGADLYARACDLLGRYDAMIAATRARPRRETLRLGMPDDYAMGWLPGLFRALEPLMERVEIEVTCDLSAHLTAAVERADIDLALVTLPAPPAGARASGALALAWLGAVPPTGPEVALAAYPPGCVFRRAMTDTLDAAGQPWRIAVQGRGQQAIFAALRAGL